MQNDMTNLRDGPAPSSSLPNATASSPLFATASTATATKGNIASHNDAQTLLNGFVFADLKSDIARNKHVAGNGAGTTTDTDATTDTTPGYDHDNDGRDSTVLRSLSNSSSRRCPAPPALNFDVSALSDIYEEEDVRSQDANANGNGNDAPTTPVPASTGGLQTPNFPDDVSTVYTNDDESEYASDLDIGRRAEKRLESAKRRLTTLEGNLTLARSSSGAMRQEALDRIPPEDEASRDVGSTVAATAATANNKDGHAHTTTGSDAKPPNPLILSRYMSDETKHTTHGSSSSSVSGANTNSNPTRGVSGHGGGMSGSNSKPERQRTTSLAGALLRKGALANTGNGTGKKGSSNDSPSSGNANASSAATPAAQSSQPSRSPRGPSPTLHSAKRSSPQLGHHNNIGRSTSAMELVSPSPLPSHSYASSHRSRSAMALRDAAYLGPSTHGLAPSPSSQYINAYSTGYPSPALSYSSLRQQHHKIHRTASTPTVGSSYKRRGDKRYSSASATTNPTTRSEQVRDLKDQVTDLQIKISQLKVKAQSDSIRRRRSLQQMKENGDPAGQPSLFTDSRQGSAAGNTYYNNKYKSLGPLDLERAARTKALRSSKDRERVSRGDVRAGGKGQPTDTTSSSVYTKWRSTSSAAAGNTPKHASVERLRIDSAASSITTGRRDKGSDGEQLRGTQAYERLGERALERMARRWSSTHGSMDSNIRRRSEGYQHHRSADTGSSGSAAVNSIAAKMALKGLAASFKHELGEGAGIWNAAYAPDQAEATEAYYIRKAAKKFGKSSGVRRAASTGDVDQGRRVTWDEESIVNARYNRHTDAGDDDDDEFEAERKSTIKAVTMANIRRSKSIAMGWLPSDIEGNNTPDSPQVMSTRLRRIGHSGMVEPTAALGSKHGIPEGLGISGFEDPAALDESSSQVDNGGDGVEEDTTPHEQRADAFDYEHFFLHSAMGHYPIDSEIEDEEEGEEGEDLSGEDEDYGDGGEGEEVIEEEEYEEDENNDRESVKTAKGNDKRNSDASSTSAPLETEPQGEENHPKKDNLLSIYPGNTSAVQGSSQESLSTILTFQTAPEARSNSGTPVQDSRHLSHSRNSSQRTVTAHRASPSVGSNASSNSGMQYKISTIRSASTPTVLIQPRLAGESRSSSSASNSRSRTANQRALPLMVDRGMQTSPEIRRDDTPVNTPSQQQQQMVAPNLHRHPTPPKSPPSSLKFQKERRSLNSLSSARTTGSTASIPESVSESSPLETKPPIDATTAAATEASGPRPLQHRPSIISSPSRSVSGSFRSYGQRSIGSSHSQFAPASRDSASHLNSMIGSLVSNAAARYAPPSIAQKAGVSSTDLTDVNQHARLSQQQHQLQQQQQQQQEATLLPEYDTARLHALLNSVGQVAFRLQVSVAEQEKHMNAIPSDHRPSTPQSVKRPGTAASTNSSMRATQVLRERLEVAKKVLDGRIELPPHSK